MFFLLVFPVVALMAIAHRCLRLYAPSNLVVARLRTAIPRWRTAGMLLACSILLLTGTRGLAFAVDVGLPPWLNLIALVLAWDAIKLAYLAIAIGVRCVVGSIRQSQRSSSSRSVRRNAWVSPRPQSGAR